MKQRPSSSSPTAERPGAQSELRGTVRRVRYRDESSQYSIAELEVFGGGEATIVGPVFPIHEGEEIRVRGAWTLHPRYGTQFRVAGWERIEPSTVEAIEKYLGSGWLPGVGPAFARRLVAAFGLDTIEILSREPERLLEVKGLGRRRAERIAAVWQQHRGVHDTMVFLRGHGISSALAAKVHRAYGAETIATVKREPYRLAREISGIGFVLADRIARSVGVAGDAPERLAAGVLHVLEKAAEQGHCYLPYDALQAHACRLLEAREEAVGDAIRELAARREIVVESGDPAEESHPRVFSRSLYDAECRVAASLARLLDRAAAPISPQASAPSLLLSDEQRVALARALREKVLIITGGPGTGKTTLLNDLLELLRRQRIAFALAAPTGRAAKRMAEATGEEARTIHRLLEYHPPLGGFLRHEENPLEFEMVIVDEASMIDLFLMDALLRAVPPEGRLVLIGDADQLPPVGPGNVLRDLIESGRVGVARLRQVFRQAKESLIVANAHRVLRGESPVFASGARASEFLLVERDRPEEVLAALKEALSIRIPALLGAEAVAAAQVLTPTHRGPLGTATLNDELQSLLNPEGPAVERGAIRFRAGDRVMQARNNYAKEVFNGDLGQVCAADPAAGRLRVRFEAASVEYDQSELDELTLAYAISVHKSQGSEYRAVALPLHTSQYPMLHRSILYTAITRARDLVLLLGSRKALALAVRNVRRERRLTGLKERLRGANRH